MNKSINEKNEKNEKSINKKNIKKYDSKHILMQRIF